MSHAVVDSASRVRQLDRQPEPDEQVTQSEVASTEKLSRLLMRILRDVAKLLRIWRPRVVDHRDVTVDATGSTVYRFPHGFGTRVNWWPVSFRGGSYGPALMEDPSTDDNTLCLVSNEAGVVSIRIEEAG